MPLFLLSRNRSPATDVTASSAAEQREFLRQFADSTTPWTFVDRRGVAHQVYLIRANEQLVNARVRMKGQTVATLRPVMTLTMIEAVSEVHETEATEQRAEEVFLLDCANQVPPLEYVDRGGSKHRVFITSLESKGRALSDELGYAVKFVDAWGGVYVQQEVALKITVTKQVTLLDPVPLAYGYSGAWGFAAYKAN